MENYKGQERREDKETRETVDSLLNCYEGNTGKLYIINTLVKQGKLSKGRAGQLLIMLCLI